MCQIKHFCVIQREYMLSNENTCYPPQMCFIQFGNKCNPTRKPVIQREYLLSKIKTCYRMQKMFYTMWKRVIQCKKFYPMQKHVYECKNRVIQREKVLFSAINVLYNVKNVIFYKKNKPRKIVITKIKI